MSKHAKLSKIASEYEKASKTPKKPKAAPKEGSDLEEAMESPSQEAGEEAMPKRPLNKPPIKGFKK